MFFFRRVKENDNPCASCASGCELKDMMEKKRKECSSKKKKRQRKIAADSLVVSKFVLPLQPQTRNKVPWMSGLVSGLQNRVRRFESARNLNYHFKALESQALSRAYFYGDRFGDHFEHIRQMRIPYFRIICRKTYKNAVHSRVYCIFLIFASTFMKGKKRL